MLRFLDQRVCAHEARDQWFVDATVHVHQVKLVQHFVAGVALVVQSTFQVVWRAAAIQVAPLAPGVVAVLLCQFAGFVADADDAAQPVGVRPVALGGAAAHHFSLKPEAGWPVGLEGGDAAFAFHFHTAGVAGLCAVALRLLDALVFRSVDELAPVAAFAQPVWHVKAGPALGTPWGGFHIAVGVVAEAAQAGYGEDGMGLLYARALVGVDVVACANTGLAAQVAVGVVVEDLLGLRLYGAFGQAVEAVVVELFVEAFAAVPVLGAGGDVAEDVVGVGFAQPCGLAAALRSVVLQSV